MNLTNENDVLTTLDMMNLKKKENTVIEVIHSPLIV